MCKMYQMIVMEGFRWEDNTEVTLALDWLNFSGYPEKNFSFAIPSRFKNPQLYDYDF